MSDPNHAGHPHSAPHPPPVRPPIAPQQHRPGITPMPTMSTSNQGLEPLTLIEDRPTSAPGTGASHMPGPPPPKKITAFGGDTVAHKKHDWKRTPYKTGTGAIRVKSFHGKYSEGGLEYLDNAVNEWLDANPDVEVKFVTPTVMTFEGKIREPALVLNVWY